MLFGSRKRCFYCNADAVTKDHVTPWSTFSNIKGHRQKSHRRIRKDFTVDSCAECNLLLSDNVFPTMEARMEFLAEKLRDRYGDILKRIRYLERVIALQKDGG